MKPEFLPYDTIAQTIVGRWKFVNKQICFWPFKFLFRFAKFGQNVVQKGFGEHLPTEPLPDSVVVDNRGSGFDASFEETSSRKDEGLAAQFLHRTCWYTS